MIKKQGSALISALFIMTLVAIAATAMSTRLQLDIYRAHLSINSDKLYLASQAVTFWAMNELSTGKPLLADETGEILSFPTQFRNFYPNVVIQGSLYDLQNRFNLNNLADDKYKPLFLKLLEHLATKYDPEQRKIILLATSSWIHFYQPGREGEEFFNYYLQQNPPYLPSKQLMQNLSEFRLVQGVDSNFYQLLSDYLIALPETTAINLNTASKPLLMSLGNGLNEEQVNKLLKLRGKNGIYDLNKVGPLLEKLNIRPEQITLESQYFMVIATVLSDDLTLTTYTILKRNKDKTGRISVSIVSESLNSL